MIHAWLQRGKVYNSTAVVVPGVSLFACRTGGVREALAVFGEVGQECRETLSGIGQPCACEEPGYFCSGIPGILAHLENGGLAPGAKVERCDQCERYPSDTAAWAKLVDS